MSKYKYYDYSYWSEYIDGAFEAVVNKKLSEQDGAKLIKDMLVELIGE